MLIGYTAIGVFAVATFSFGLGWHYGEKGPTKRLVALETKIEAENLATEQLWLKRLNDQAEAERIDRDKRIAKANRLRQSGKRVSNSTAGVSIPSSVVRVWDAAVEAATEGPAVAGVQDSTVPTPPGAETIPDVLVYNEQDLAMWQTEQAIVYIELIAIIDDIRKRYEAVRRSVNGD